MLLLSRVNEPNLKRKYSQINQTVKYTGIEDRICKQRKINNSFTYSVHFPGKKHSEMHTINERHHKVSL